MIAQRASEMTAPSIEWLWPGYLAFGNLAILDGDPGQGKSMITLDLAARLTTGRPWPDGTPGVRPAPVYILRTEDPDDVILPRLRSLGAAMPLVFVWPWLAKEGLPSLPSDIDRLDSELSLTGAKLLVIDPIVAFLDTGVMMNNDVQVRWALRSLTMLAQKRSCVILLVRHLNKKPGHNALYRGGGSIAFTAACRLAWLAGRDPKMGNRFVLAQPKNNYAARQPSLAYTLPKDGPRVEWQGTSAWSADDLSVSRRLRPARERAKEFLLSFLDAGPRPCQEVWRAVKKEGMSVNTIKRAKDELGIRSQTVPGKGKEVTYWLLEDQLLPPELVPFPEVDQFFQDMRNERRKGLAS